MLPTAPLCIAQPAAAAAASPAGATAAVEGSVAVVAVVAAEGGAAVGEGTTAIALDAVQYQDYLGSVPYIGATVMK